MTEENPCGSMLKRARERMAWTQQDVANKLNVSRLTISRWENDYQHPSAFYHKQLIDVLGLNDKEVGALYNAPAQEPPIIDEEIPKKDNLPPQNPFFTGRETGLDQLLKQLQETGTTAITQRVSISGLGGIGKTQLALAYAYRFYPNVYHVALWVYAETEETLQSSFADLTEVLELPERDEQELDRRILAVKKWLKEHTNWLLIMDNADDLELALSFFPSGRHGHILLTTRSQFAGKIGARQLIIDKFEPEEGLVFLLRRSIDANPNTVAENILEPAKELVKLLDGHPLALDQAGAYIEETGVSFADYAQLFAMERHFLLNRRDFRGSNNEHPESVVATVLLSFSKACEQHPNAGEVLYFCSYWSPDNIPESIFYLDDNLRLDTKSFNEIIAALRRYSLFKRDAKSKSLSMHRLVQAVLQDTMPLELKVQIRERVVKTGSQWGALYNSRDRARLYEQRGNYGRARFYYHRTLFSLNDYLGSTHPLVEEIRNDYVELLRRIGHDKEAAAVERNIDWWPTYTGYKTNPPKSIEEQLT